MLEPSGFREIARSASITYPVPYAFALCLAFTLATLGGAVWASSPLRWVLVGFGATSMLYGLVIHTFAVLRKPELLRSERYQTVQRVIGFVEDSDRGPETIELGRLMLDDRPMKKVSPSPERRQERTEHEQD